MLDTKEMRQVYCEELIKFGTKNRNIVVIEADLMGSTGTKAFKDALPNQFINVGIAEANMIGVAAGLASVGKIPFCHSFSPFVTRRCYDQVSISVSYSKQNVKIVGTDPGIMATNNGGTHMSLEDVGIMKNIPNLTIFEPIDATMLKKAIPQIIESDKAMYIRLFRKKAEQVFDDSLEFDLNKAIEISTGSDVMIIASGIMVARSLKAVEILKQKGISAGVLCIHTIKPIDKDAIIKCAKTAKVIVTAENHQKTNGLGSSVAEVLAENYPKILERVGVEDRFGEVGNEEYLSQLLGLTIDDIVKSAEKALARVSNV